MEHDSEFGIVLWGATGFTGRIAAEKLAARIGNQGDLRWAIGGRNRSELERANRAPDHQPEPSTDPASAAPPAAPINAPVTPAPIT